MDVKKYRDCCNNYSDVSYAIREYLLDIEGVSKINIFQGKYVTLIESFDRKIDGRNAFLVNIIEIKRNFFNFSINDEEILEKAKEVVRRYFSGGYDTYVKILKWYKPFSRDQNHCSWFIDGLNSFRNKSWDKLADKSRVGGQNTFGSIEKKGFVK